MTAVKPDRAAVILAAPATIGAIVAWARGAPWAAVGLAGAAAVMLRVCWRIPECDDDGNDIEALIEATREDIPNYVPAEWTKGFSK